MRHLASLLLEAVIICAAILLALVAGAVGVLAVLGAVAALV